MRVVSLHSPAKVSGISTAGARLSRLPPPHEPWTPLLIGRALTDAIVRDTPLHEAPGLSLCAWPADMSPVGQVLLVRERLRELGARVVIPNDLNHGFVAAALDHHRGVRVGAWLHAEHHDGDELFERGAPLCDAWRCVSERGLARAMRVGAGLDIPPAGEICPACVEVPPACAAPTLDGPLRLVYAGRLEKHVKRVMDLALLADEFDARGVPFTLWIAGDGPARDDLARAMDTHIRDGRVSLLGSVAQHDMPALLTSADALVLVSLSEGMPTTVMEAFACGRIACVTAGCGGAVPLIEHSGAGVVVPTGDMRAMAAHLARFAADRPSLAELGARAHTLAHERCSPRAMGPVYDRFTREAANAPMRLDRDDPASLAQHWRRILVALEGIGQCTRESLHQLANAWLDDLSLAPIVRRALVPGSPELPLELPGLPTPAERLLDAALAGLGRSGVSRVVLYGAGRHTARVARVIARAAGPDARPRIVGILDDRAGQLGGPESPMLGLPVAPPSRLADLGAEAIVISSDEHERDMLPRAGDFAAGRAVVPLYSVNEPAISAVA